ncbi:MAG: hypothetical protein O2894_01975 [Planctomycetota bacterium]|nr:hypothetical protein [Planctomycetota bacterium]
MNVLDTVPAPRKWSAAYRAFVLGIVVGCVLLLPLVFLSKAAPAPALADIRLPLRSEGVVVPFTLSAPGTVRITVKLPAMLEADVAIGPLYVAQRPGTVLEPEPREDRVHRIAGSTAAAIVERFDRAGAYAVRVPSIPTAMGMESEMFVEVSVRSAD